MIQPVISRADEIKELLGAWQALSGNTTLKKIPNALKKGIAECFNKFDGYHFRKYNKQGKEAISFKDAVYITHPKPTSKEKSELFKKILEDNLDPITTWEVDISAAGSDLDKKREAWESLILNKKLPYMAALRNIRNILKAQVSREAITALLELLGNKEQILRSKQFPFRWYSACKQLNMDHDPNVMLHLNSVNRVLESAITTSIDNIPGIERLRNESSLIACDVSGSMQTSLSDRSYLDLIEVGILLGKMLNKVSDRTITGVFGNDWAPVSFGTTVLDSVNYPHVGLATYGYKVIKWLTQNQIRVDNVMYFSDAQIYSDLGFNGSGYGYDRSHGATRSALETSWNEYKKFHPTARIYMFDLSSYGTTPIDLMRQDVYMMNGWSPNIFKVLGGLQDWKSLKNYITSYRD